MTFFIESNSFYPVLWYYSHLWKKLLKWLVKSEFWLTGPVSSSSCLLPKYWPLNFDLKADIMLLLHLSASLHNAQTVTVNIAV